MPHSISKSHLSERFPQKVEKMGVRVRAAYIYRVKIVHHTLEEKLFHEKLVKKG